MSSVFIVRLCLLNSALQNIYVAQEYVFLNIVQNDIKTIVFTLFLDLNIVLI